MDKGWILTLGSLKLALFSLGCDLRGTAYNVGGVAVAGWALDDESDAVVYAGAWYTVNGERRQLVDALRRRGVGIAVDTI